MSKKDRELEQRVAGAIMSLDKDPAEVEEQAEEETRKTYRLTDE